MQFGFPVVKLCDMLHDREAEAGPAKRTAAFLMNPVETFEDAGLILLGDPASMIGHGNDSISFLTGQRQFDIRAPAVLDRIVNQIGQSLFQQLGVAGCGDRFGMRNPDRHPMLYRFLLKGLHT